MINPTNISIIIFIHNFQSLARYSVLYRLLYRPSFAERASCLAYSTRRRPKRYIHITSISSDTEPYPKPQATSASGFTDTQHCAHCKSYTYIHMHTDYRLHIHSVPTLHSPPQFIFHIPFHTHDVIFYVFIHTLHG